MKDLIINKNDLCSLYIDDNRSAQDIADVYGIDLSYVYILLKKYEILTHAEASRNRLPTELTQEERHIIQGTLLGDGCLRSSKTRGYNGNAYLRILQCRSHHGYVRWLHNKLNRWTTKRGLRFESRSMKLKGQTHANVYHNVAFWTVTHPVFDEFYKLFYKEKKIVPLNIKDYLNPLSTAVWYMDDGYLWDKYRCSFCTDCFSEGEVNILIDAIKSVFNIKAYLSWHHGDVKRPRITTYSRELVPIIGPYVWKVACMRRKLPAGYFPENVRNSSQNQTLDASNGDDRVE